MVRTDDHKKTLIIVSVGSYEYISGVNCTSIIVIVAVIAVNVQLIPNPAPRILNSLGLSTENPSGGRSVIDLTPIKVAVSVSLL